jgi:hypothetical protein
MPMMPLVEAAHISWRPLGRLLVEQGLLSEDELERALEEQVSTGRRLGETLIELGFVSHPALSRALAGQYGIELATEKGFGTGLRVEIERRHNEGRDGEFVPGPEISDTAQAPAFVSESEAPEQDAGAAENLHLAQLEEQWAKLAAAEERLADAENELTALRQTAERRHDQSKRLVGRVRTRDRRIAELSAIERNEPARSTEATPSQPDANVSRGHLIYAQLAGRYVLVERDGEPPGPGVTLELPELAEETLLVSRVGKSPLPNDARPCVFAQQVFRWHD